MATACVLYQPEGIHNQAPTVDSGRNGSETTAQTTSIQQTTLQSILHGQPITPHNLSDEETLRLDIDELCTATLAIDNAFYDIEVRLSDATKEQNKRADLYDTCSTLEAQWKKHHRTYIELLWRSRKLAGEAQAVVDDFRQMVLPLLRSGKKSEKEKRQLIQEQIKLLQGTSQPSEQVCQDFIDFGDTLDKYITEFSRVVEGLGISEQSQKVDQLKEQLSDAESDMKDVSREVKDLGWQLGKGVAVVGIAALLAFVTPSLFMKLAMAGVVISALSTDYFQIKDSGAQLVKAWGRYNVAAKKYRTIKAEYDLENACLNQMLKLESTLQDAKPLVEQVTMKLSIFEDVWAIITADIRKLENWLRIAGDPSSQLFIVRVQRLEEMYGYLSQALRHYQVTVRLPDNARHHMGRMRRQS